MLLLSVLLLCCSTGRLRYWSDPPLPLPSSLLLLSSSPPLVAIYDEVVMVLKALSRARCAFAAALA